MKRSFRRAYLFILGGLAFILVSLSGYLAPLQGQTPATSTQEDLPVVTTLVQNAVRRDRLRGAAMILVRNNRVVYRRAFGDYTINTVVPIASASKLLSASVIMSLVDEGRLSLDAPISKYLPNLTDRERSITLRQLLSHTSGLPSNNRCLFNRSTTLAECADRILEAGLQSDPGSEFRYGGASFQVAGRIAEVVSGKSWNTLFEEKIKRPLNMVDTSYGDTENPWIGGGASSTLQDYAHLLQVHLNGGVFNGKRVLSAAIVAEMQKDQTTRSRIAFTPQPDNRRYGLGAWRDIVDSNGRAIQLSSQGAFGFSPWIDVRRNLVGVFLVRNRLRNVYGTVEEVQKTFRELVDSKRLS
jgi:CubicO group peptidase (beta-lactamase class C family)